MHVINTSFFSQEHAKKHTMKSSMKIKRQVEEMMLIKGSLKRLLNLGEAFPRERQFLSRHHEHTSITMLHTYDIPNLACIDGDCSHISNLF